MVIHEDFAFNYLFIIETYNLYNICIK